MLPNLRPELGEEMQQMISIRNAIGHFLLFGSYCILYFFDISCKELKFSQFLSRLSKIGVEISQI